MVIVIVAIGLGVLVWLAAMATRQTAGGAGPVYAPSAVIAGMARWPAAWLGRTLLVQGEVIPGNAATFSVYCARSRPCPNVPNSTAALWNGGLGDGADAMARDEVLPLVIAPEDPLLSLLRRVPLVRSHIPRPQRLDILHMETYRVKLQTAPCAFPPGQTCYEVVLLDGWAGIAQSVAMPLGRPLSR